MDRSEATIAHHASRAGSNSPEAIMSAVAFSATRHGSCATIQQFSGIGKKEPSGGGSEPTKSALTGDAAASGAHNFAQSRPSSPEETGWSGAISESSSRAAERRRWILGAGMMSLTMPRPMSSRNRSIRAAAAARDSPSARARERYSERVQRSALVPGMPPAIRPFAPPEP